VPFQKPRILVVEDEPLVALLVKQYLDDLGCDCVGPVADIQTAEHQARNGTFDAAVLNLRLGGKDAYSVASILAYRDIPFAFASGVPHSGLDGAWKDRPYIEKPYTVADLRGLLVTLLKDGVGLRGI
jgi:DNA-binding response OmpR family regulator